MQAEHRIDELIVDLSFSTTRLARHEKALLSDWLSEDLLPALDQLFSRISPGKQILRFETLEFDFGDLTSRNYQQHIREQLLQKFAQLLQTQLLAVVPANQRLLASADNGDNQNARVALTQLFNYLASGQLSAHQPFEQSTRLASRKITSATDIDRNLLDGGIANDKEIADNKDKKDTVNNSFSVSQPAKKSSAPIINQIALHEQLLDAVIAQHNIAELLRELPQRDVLIQRLLTQFSVPQRLELLRQLAPQQVQQAIALLDLLQFFESNAIYTNTYKVDSNLLWQALLQLGLEYPQANVEFWLTHIFSTVSANTAIDFIRLQKNLTEITIPFSSAAMPLINLQTQIAQRLADTNTSTDTQFSEEPDTDEFIVQIDGQSKTPEQLRQLIAAAFIRADANQLQQLWPQLIANEPHILLAAIEYYLPQAEIRQQLMLRLPLVLQADIIALLVPVFKDVFLQLQRQAEQLIELLQVQLIISPEIDPAGVTGQTPELLLRQLWEISLGLIFNNQSALTNTHYSTDSNFLVRNLAVRYADLHNLDFNIVQQAFDSLLNQAPINQHTRTNPVALLESSTELHENIAAVNEQQYIKPEMELVFNNATAVSTESGNGTQQNIGLEKNNQVNNIPDNKNQTADSYHSNSQDANNDEGIYSEVFSSDVIRQEAVDQSVERSDVNSLSRVSDHQLFDLCLRLKSGALPWASLANDIPFLQRLISSYIRLGHSATAENCADFVAAITAQAEFSSAPAAFYLVVLQTLIADKLIDLEAIALGVQRSANAATVISKTTIATRKETDTREEVAVLTSTSHQSELHSSARKPVATVAPAVQLETLALQLQQGRIKPEVLNLTGEQLAKLVDIFITTETTIAQATKADLLTAVHQQARQTNRKDYYYQRVLTLLVRKEMLDLMRVCEQVNQLNKSESTVLLNKPATNNTHVKKVSAEQSQNAISVNEQLLVADAVTVSSADAAEIMPTAPTVHQQDIAQPITAVATASNNIDAIVRALLSESEPMQRLQVLQLDLAQWQAVVAELINAAQFVDKDSSVELIEAIQAQARVALAPAVYYRLVIQAVLARAPIDLEAFACAENLSLRNNPATNNIHSTHVKKVSAEQSQNAISVNEQLLVADAVTVSSADAAEIMPTAPTVHKQDIAQPITTVATASNNIDAIVRALLSESEPMQRLQVLQLDLAQWQAVVAELINAAQLVDKDSSVELIEAIKAQARVVLTPAVYYRLVIQALLQQHPIDLEAFAATAIDEKQDSSIRGELNNIVTNTDIATSVDNDIYQHTQQSDARRFATEELKPAKFNTTALNTAQFSSGNISQNTLHSNHINPEQTMDYPLLTGSDNSLRKPALSLAQLLAAELPLSQEQLLALQQHINTLLNRSNPALIAEWCELLAVVQHTKALIHSVPAHLLHQIAMRLQASLYTWLDALVKVVMEALALLVSDINKLAIKQAKWEFIFSYLFIPNSDIAETNARALELSIELCERLASAAGIDDVQRLVNLTQRRIALLKPPAQQKPAMRLQDITTNPATHSDATTPQWEAGLHINNAGQVLAAAFLPRLFSMLNLMQDGKFIHFGAADRAVHLVQFMVTGQSATPEYDLMLNKILCGIGTSIPVSAGIEITEQEQTLIEQMLTSMIQHWKVLGSTSISGLRETFFQRQGWLVLEEDCWRLKVKEQTFDLLLDRLPWSISLIKHGWMDKPLRVSWRNPS